MDPKKIFIPKECYVGFQERSDTYSGKLAYVIYKDEKGVIRKENSWNSWRNKKIDPITFDNIPTEGFILNKTVGGKCSWSNRSTYCRIYDPRGFEVEISPDNLMYILETNETKKGKIISGKFVYSWLEKELILMPIDSSDYDKAKEYSDKQFEFNKTEKITNKTLIPGCTYKLKYIPYIIRQQFKSIDNAIFIGNIPIIKSDLKHSSSQLIFYVPEYPSICFISSINNIMYQEKDIPCNEKLVKEITTLLGYTAYTKEFWTKNLSKISGYKSTDTVIFEKSNDYLYYPRSISIFHTDGKIYQFFPEFIKEENNWWYGSYEYKIKNPFKKMDNIDYTLLMDSMNDSKWEPIFSIENNEIKALNSPFIWKWEYKHDDPTSPYSRENFSRINNGPKNNDNNIVPSIYMTAYQIDGYESLSLSELSYFGFFSQKFTLSASDSYILTLPTKVKN